MFDSNSGLVIFGLSNILSDIFDAAYSVGLRTTRIVLDHPEQPGPRDRSLRERLDSLSQLMPRPDVITMDEFVPAPQEVYLLGPTTPTRAAIAAKIEERWALRFHRLVHRTAYVSPLSSLGEGCFVGANSVIAPGTLLGRHVFVNRGVTIGHDNRIGDFSRIQPGASLGGLSQIGSRVTIGLGATLLERLVIGDDATVAGGAVVLKDVAPATLVAGVPATFRKHLGVV